VIRSILASLVVCAFALPAHADEAAPDPTKATCAEHFQAEAQKLQEHGGTLAKGGKLMLGSVQGLRAAGLKQEAGMVTRMAKSMLASGKAMIAEGKWLAGKAEKFKGSKHNHTVAEHMAAMGKAFGQLDAKRRDDIIAKGKDVIAGMKAWSADMAKSAEMMSQMFDKMGQAPAGSAEAEKK
jgi:hypothetical protein